MARGIGPSPGKASLRRLGGDSGAAFSYSPAESATILPRTAVWISQQGVTVATGVSAWASYLGGLTCTLSQATGSLQPSYNASGGVGGRPLITVDGVDDFLRGTVSAKGSSYTNNEMGIVGRRVSYASGTDFVLGYEVAGSLVTGIRDGSTAATWRGTDLALYDLTSTSDPDGVDAFYSFNGTTSLGEVRKNGSTEASNTTTCGTFADNREFVFGGRVAASAYANWSAQALVWGEMLSASQRDYLRGALTFYTGINC